LGYPQRIVIMLVLLLPILAATTVVARRRSRRPRLTNVRAVVRRSRRPRLTDVRGSVGACCRSCAVDQAAGRMPAGATCDPCNASTSHARKPITCPPPPLLLDQIDGQIAVQYRRGATVDEATHAALETVYPRLPDGERIPWRSLRANDSPWLHLLQRRTRARVLFGFAQEALALASSAEAKLSASWADAMEGSR
jgi:hypothetical protein